MNLYSYVVAADSGFAPNPFGGCCTLACCKPAIRRTADVGDLIVGLTPKGKGNKIVYIMRVTDKLTFAEYWNHPGFQRKKPGFEGNDNKSRCGDNIYRPLRNGQFRQEHFHDTNDEKNGKYVLLSDDFVYFGAAARNLPQRFQRLIVGRGHRRLTSSNDERLIRDFSKWFDGMPRGMRGLPAKWTAKSSCSPRKYNQMRRLCD